MLIKDLQSSNNGLKLYPKLTNHLKSYQLIVCLKNQRKESVLDYKIVDKTFQVKFVVKKSNFHFIRKEIT